MNQKDLTGRRFGHLIAEKMNNRSNNGNMWLCKCDCGNETLVLSTNLLKGHSKSCGCLRVDTIVKQNRTHGMAKTRLYNTWSNMKTRCANEGRSMYYTYGGRGIKVCEEWNDSFESFYKWAMENGYKDSLSIDRIDNDGDYSPENCRWSTSQQQARNKQTTIRIMYRGQTKTLKEWCDKYNLNYHTAYRRLRKGWGIKKLLTENPLKYHHRDSHPQKTETQL